MRLWKGMLISSALHAALFWTMARNNPIRMPPQEGYHFIIVDVAPIPSGWPSGSLAATVDASEPPSAGSAPGAQPVLLEPPQAAPKLKPAARKPDGARRKAKPAAFPAEAPLPVQPAADAPPLEETAPTGALEPPSSPARTDGGAGANAGGVPSGGGGQLRGAVSAGTPGGLGSLSGPVAFGSLEGPRFVRRTPPRYPPRALSMSREGTVVLRLTIDEQGKLVNVDVIQSAGFGFDEEAVRAIRDSTFRAAVRNGRPTISLAELPVRFVLRNPKED